MMRQFGEKRKKGFFKTHNKQSFNPDVISLELGEKKSLNKEKKTFFKKLLEMKE